MGPVQQEIAGAAAAAAEAAAAARGRGQAGDSLGVPRRFPRWKASTHLGFGA